MANSEAMRTPATRSCPLTTMSLKGTRVSCQKWLIPGLWQEIYKMILKYFVVQESKKDHYQGHVQRTQASTWRCSHYQRRDNLSINKVILATIKANLICSNIWVILTLKNKEINKFTENQKNLPRHLQRMPVNQSIFWQRIKHLSCPCYQTVLYFRITW